jgi:hypothetical protein
MNAQAPTFPEILKGSSYRSIYNASNVTRIRYYYDIYGDHIFVI